MIRPIKAIKTIDEILDCVPVVSTVKNAGILLYQLVHKVNKVNPVNVSLIDDIKIHVLSKNEFIAGIAMIPIVGNLTALIYHLKYAIEKAKGMLSFEWRPMGYLAEATRVHSWGLKKHSHEVAALYLARNPNRSEEKLGKALSFAAIAKGNQEIFKLILDSRTTWSSNTIKKVLECTDSIEIAKLVLDKHSTVLTDQQAGSIVEYCTGRSYKKNNFGIIELLLTTYPSMHLDQIGSGLEGAARNENGSDLIELLITRFPKIEKEYMAAALKKASEKGLTKNIEVLLKHLPSELIIPHVDNLLEQAADRGDKEFIDSIVTNYGEHITAASIAKILRGTIKVIYFDKDDKHLLIMQEIVNKCHSSLSGKDLEPVMEAAASYNINVFKDFLRIFTQLQPENLQKILDEAVFVHGREGDFLDYAKKWQQVAKLIQEKFPDMKPVNPYL